MSAARHPVITPILPDITQIDTIMAGDTEFNAVYLIAASEPTLIETGPGADAPVVIEALDRMGVGRDDLAHIVVTHIHLDHAGAAGTLAARFPYAKIWVHEAGAAHLADPARLIASTARTYGEARMREFFGETEPVPPDRLRAVRDGERVNLGDRGLVVMHTPGHASHHVALRDESSGAIFTGEAIGSHLPWADCYRPALPPPELDVEMALRSILRIRDSVASSLLTSHFGQIHEPTRACDRAAQRVREWSETAREVISARVWEGPEDAVPHVSEALHRKAAADFLADCGRPIDMPRYNRIGSIEMNAAGLNRYWRRRWEREASENA